MLVSHKWVHQVFRQRGIPAPDPELLRLSLEQASVEQHQEVLALGKRIESGADTGDEIPRLRHILKTLQTQPVKAITVAPMVAPSVTAVAPVATFTPPPAQIDLLDPSLHVEPSGPTKTPTRRTRAAPPQPVTATTDSTSYTEEKKRQPKHHIYGSKAALTIELDRLRERDESGQERWSLMVEAALAKSARSYDWDHKIAFQLTRGELPAVAATLMGYLESLHLKNHGAQSDKSLDLQNQGDKVFVKLSQGKQMMAGPVTSGDVHAWLELVMLALLRNAPEVGEMMHMAMIKRVAEMERFKAAA